MTNYFSLQFKMLNRRLAEFGIHPILGFVLGVAGFVLLFEYLFVKTAFAKYGVLLVAISAFIGLSKKSRMEFLFIVFGSVKSKQIRIIENILASLPFTAVLVYHEALLESIITVGISIPLAFFSFGANRGITIPTPFSKKPFEFTVGFRKTFFLFPIAYLLTFFAITVNNFSLGIFSLVLTFLVSFSFYTNPEDDYFVWIHSSKPSPFLIGKLKTASLYITLLMLPVAISLCAFYPLQSHIILLFTVLGYFFLWTFILAKYAAFPGEMSLPEAIPIAASVFFPPLLLLLIPYFHRKSVKNLNTLLK